MRRRGRTLVLAGALAFAVGCPSERPPEEADVPAVASGAADSPTDRSGGAATPEALAETARACVAGDDPVSCLSAHVTERVYFPQARDLRGASDACAEAFDVAREDDGGHGWYHAPERFLSCVWTAEEPWPGAGDTRPREVALACIREGELTRLGDDASRLETDGFMWDMRREDGRWVFESLLLKP